MAQLAMQMKRKNAPLGPVEEIQGTVEKLIFSGDNNYHVILLTETGGGAVVATGHFHKVGLGDKLKLTGRWVTHSKFGRQFGAESYQLILPATEKGIKAFLSGGMIKGVGPKTAAKIVDFFGAGTLDLIRENPERLLEVPGIGRDKARKIKDSLGEYAEIEKIMVALQGFGVSSAYALKIHQHFGGKAVHVLQKSPYELTEVWGIGFLIADKIARGTGIDKNDPMRMNSGLLYVLEEAAGDGHVCMPFERLMESAVKILECERDRAEGAVQCLLDLRSIMHRQVDATDYYYLPYLYASEKGLASRLVNLLGKASPAAAKRKVASLVRKAEKDLGITFAAQQAAAVQMAIERGVMVLTGGPGTGKTTIVRAIVEIYESLGAKVLLAAPTGRAAKRLTETTGREAKTIHRLLEFDPKTNGVKRNEENPLNGDLVVVDEASMLDVVLAYQLIRAVKPGSALVLVGDVDQLPSVGPGRVLRDIIDSGAIPTVRLTEIYRQAQGSLIITNAHRVNRGVMPERSGSVNRDFFVIEEEDPEKVADTIVGLVSKRLPSHFGLDPVNDIQVLAPMRRGPIGVQTLNQMLQKALSPNRGDSINHMGTIYHAGDKVMQIRNNYEKGVFNGDSGIVASVDMEERKLVIRFDQGDVTYEGAELDQIVLSYCCSVHKSQGSEYPAVVIPVHTQHFVMLQRNLLYTAITRGKKAVVLIGTMKAIAMAVKNDAVPERNSHLCSLLQQ